MFTLKFALNLVKHSQIFKIFQQACGERLYEQSKLQCYELFNHFNLNNPQVSNKHIFNFIKVQSESIYFNVKSFQLIQSLYVIIRTILDYKKICIFDFNYLPKKQQNNPQVCQTRSKIVRSTSLNLLNFALHICHCKVDLV